MMQQIADMLSGGSVGVVLAFLAGILTSLSPCALSVLPLLIGYVGGTGVTGRRAFGLSLVFAVGSAVSLTVLGVSAALAGRVLSGMGGRLWYAVAGVLMVLMALQTWELFALPLPAGIRKGRVKGYAGALLLGMLGGLFASGCATPVLAAMLTLVATEASTAKGALLFFCYALGSGLPVVVFGSGLGTVQQLKQSRHYAGAEQGIRILTGMLILCLGLWFFYLAM